MQSITCIVEGHGEVLAIPRLCHRILRELIGSRPDWLLDEKAIRIPRSRIVHPASASKHRSNVGSDLERALRSATLRARTRGVLVTCDADDDCPATWLSGLPPEIQGRHGVLRVRGVMACREYESWLIASWPRAARERVRAVTPDEKPRDAKRALGVLFPDYRPVLHQLELTQSMDLRAAWSVSDSFDKLVRSLAELVGTAPPRRPRRRT
jgi:hypothetical protein